MSGYGLCGAVILGCVIAGSVIVSKWTEEVDRNGYLRQSPTGCKLEAWLVDGTARCKAGKSSISCWGVYGNYSYGILEDEHTRRNLVWIVGVHKIYTEEEAVQRAEQRRTLGDVRDCFYDRRDFSDVYMDNDLSGDIALHKRQWIILFCVPPFVLLLVLCFAGYYKAESIWCNDEDAYNKWRASSPFQIKRAEVARELGVDLAAVDVQLESVPPAAQEPAQVSSGGPAVTASEPPAPVANVGEQKPTF